MCVLQNSMIRPHASMIRSSGTVSTILRKPGKLKQGKPGNSRTLCSAIKASANSRQVANFGNFSSSTLIIKYIAPFGSIGTSPGACFSSFTAVLACCWKRQKNILIHLQTLIQLTKIFSTLPSKNFCSVLRKISGSACCTAKEEIKSNR